MKYFKNLFLWMVLVTAQSGFAQTTLSLKECIEYSLKNHRSNDVYQNEVAIAREKAAEGLASYLPQVNGSLAFDDNIKRQTTVIPAGAFSPKEVRIQFGNQYNTLATVQLDQTIYDQSLIVSLQANKPSIEMAELRQVRNNEDLVYNTALAYYQVLTFKQQSALLQDNEKKYNELLTILKLQYEKGVLQKVDLDKVRVTLNNVVSQHKVVQTNIELAMNRLKYAMGMPMEEKLTVKDSIPQPETVAAPQATEFDPANRTDFKIQQRGILLQEIDLKRRRAQAIPAIAGYARYGGQSFGNEFSNSLSRWFDFASIGLRINVPIFSGFRRSSQIRQTELGLLNARANLQLTEDNFRLQVQNSNTQLFSSFTNLTSNRDNMTLAKDVFDTTLLRYQKGIISLADFLSADYSYKEAQSQYLTSLLNYMSARLEVERAQGTITQYVNQL